MTFKTNGLQIFETNMMRTIRNRNVPFLLAALLSFAAQAETTDTWKQECVGRSKVSLPPDVEMAAISYDNFAKEISGGSRLSVSQFEDGQRAGWSSIWYLNRLFVISNELERIQIDDLRSLFLKQPERERDYLKMLDTPGSRAKIVPEVKSNSPQVMSWNYDSYISYLHQIQNHLLLTAIKSDGESPAESNEIFSVLAKNTNYRGLFSVPSGSGVCLPFAFIRDNGSEPREISMSYRVKSHPDVMIVLTDATAEELNDSVKKSGKTPEYEINDFWSQYEVSRTGKSVSTRWPLSSKHTIEVDGRKGVASFVNITRKDDSKDFGYLAIVPGDTRAKTDVPALRLFVVREGSYARKKGIEPIGEKAFLELVERIASSVQVRRN